MRSAVFMSLPELPIFNKKQQARCHFSPGSLPKCQVLPILNRAAEQIRATLKAELSSFAREDAVSFFQRLLRTNVKPKTGDRPGKNRHFLDRATGIKRPGWSGLLPSATYCFIEAKLWRG